MKLRAEGNRIVRDGSPVVLRGATLVSYYWKYPHNRQQYQFDLTALRALYEDWRATAATVWFASGPIVRGEVDFLNYLDLCVNIAVEQDAYLMLAYAGPEPNVGTHPFLITSEGREAHALLAKRYADVPNVLHITQAEPGKTVRTVAEWQALRDVQEQTIDLIRAEKPDAMVLVSGARWSQDVYWMLDYPIRRNNVAVKPHLYDGRNAGTTMEETMRRSGTLGLSDRYPIVVGEFGWGSKSNEEDIWLLIETAERNLSGWQAWNFNSEGSPCLLASKNPADRTEYGELVYREMRRLLEVPFDIDCGAESTWVDQNGTVWEADQPWSDQALHGYEPADAGRATHGNMTERWGLTAYYLRLPEGTYDVDLILAETWDGITGPEQRVFDVGVNNQVFEGIDPYAVAGFGEPLVLTASDVKITADELLTIEFAKVTQQPAIKAIKVRPAQTDGQEDVQQQLDAARIKIRALQRVIARAKATLAEAEE